MCAEYLECCLYATFKGFNKSKFVCAHIHVCTNRCTYIQRKRGHKCGKIVSSSWCLHMQVFVALSIQFSLSLAILRNKKCWCRWEEMVSVHPGWSRLWDMSGCDILVISPVSSKTPLFWVMYVFCCFGGVQKGASICGFSFFWATNLQWSGENVGGEWQALCVVSSGAVSCARHRLGGRCLGQSLPGASISSIWVHVALCFLRKCFS